MNKVKMKAYLANNEKVSETQVYFETVSRVNGYHLGVQYITDEF